MDLPASVANKRLTAKLSPLDATLTKNRGWGYSSTSGTHPPPRIYLSFQRLTHCPFCKSFLLICIHLMGGVRVCVATTSRGHKLCAANHSLTICCGRDEQKPSTHTDSCTF